MIQKLCTLLLTGMLLLSTSTAVSAAIIVNATQIPVNDGTALKDVPRSHYAYEAITALRDKEILLYYPDFTLHPNEPILIEEVAIMLNKILGNERDIEALYDRAIDYPDPKEGIPSSLLKQIPKHILAKGHLFNAKNNYYYFTHEHFQKVLHEIASIFNVSHDTKQKMLAYKNPNLDTKYVSNAEAAKALYPLFLEKAPNFDYKSYYGENMFTKLSQSLVKFLMQIIDPV